jgi:hypothetical protein
MTPSSLLLFLLQVHTGGEDRWPDYKAFWGPDHENGNFEFPGFSVEAVRYILDETKLQGDTVFPLTPAYLLFIAWQLPTTIEACSNWMRIFCLYYFVNIYSFCYG